MSSKQHGNFAILGFVLPLIRQIPQNTEKYNFKPMNCSVQNECKRFQNIRPVMRQIYIYTFIYERSFLAGQTFQISNFASDDTCLKYPVCVCFELNMSVLNV